jgi:hypothetical protein
MSVWEQISAKDKIELLKTSLTPGKILYIYSNFTNPPKNKYLIVANLERQLLFFTINSAVPNFILKNANLLSTQILIKKSDHPFLEHDSFINCNECINCISFDNIFKQIADDGTRIKGTISHNIRDQIIDTLSNSDTISPEHIRLITKNLLGIEY